MARPVEGGKMTAFHFEDHPLWIFSLKVHDNEGVPAACIALRILR